MPHLQTDCEQQPKGEMALFALLVVQSPLVYIPDLVQRLLTS